jgi:hypothetical protein
LSLKRYTPGRAVKGLLKSNFNLIFKVLTAPGPGCTAAKATHTASQDIAEYAFQVLRFIAIRLTGPRLAGKAPGISVAFGGFSHLVGILPVITILIVLLAFFRVREDFICLVNLFKRLLGGFVTRINIRMVLARQTAVSCLDIFITGSTADS